MKKYNFNITFFSTFTDEFSRVDKNRGDFKDTKEDAINNAKDFIKKHSKRDNGCHVYAESYDIVEIDVPLRYEFNGEFIEYEDYEDWDLLVGESSLQDFVRNGFGRAILDHKVRLTIEVIE